MITLRINGSPFAGNITGLRTMEELVELVRASIDPELVLTQILINDQDLTDADWRVPLSVQGDAVIDVTTGTVRSYTEDRLLASMPVAQRILREFAESRASLQQGSTAIGNSQLSTAVTDLNAFIGWMASVLNQAPDVTQAQVEKYNALVGRLHEICKQLLQQQLYQSWWALASSLQNQLEPEIGHLVQFCAELIPSQGEITNSISQSIGSIDSSSISGAERR